MPKRACMNSCLPPFSCLQNSVDCTKEFPTRVLTRLTSPWPTGSMTKYGGGQYLSSIAKQKLKLYCCYLTAKLKRSEPIRTKRKQEMESSPTFVHRIQEIWLVLKPWSALWQLRRTTTLLNLHQKGLIPNRQLHTS